MTLKRYVGGLAVYTTDECLHIWSLELRLDDKINSFTVCTAFGFLGNFKHNKQFIQIFLAGKIWLMFYNISDVQRFDVKDKLVTAFQLESLILAQNERWRQA